MAFCSNCGANLNGANFCPSCGAAVNGKTVQTWIPVGADVRKQTLGEMELMLRYFSPMAASYDEYDAVSAEIMERSTRRYTFLLIIAIFFAFVGSSLHFWVMLLVPLMCVIVYFDKKQENNRELRAAVARREKVTQELFSHYKKYGDCPIGFEYTKPATLSVLYDLVRQGRALTHSDAINIYLADIKDAKMYRLQEKTAKAAKTAAMYSAANFWFK